MSQDSQSTAEDPRRLSRSLCERCFPLTGEEGSSNLRGVSARGDAGPHVRRIRAKERVSSDRLRLVSRTQTGVTQTFECRVRACDCKDGSAFQNLMESCFNSGTGLVVEVAMFNKVKYSGDLMCLSKRSALLRVFGVPDEAFKPENKSDEVPRASSKRKYSLPSGPQSAPAKESLLSRIGYINAEMASPSTSENFYYLSPSNLTYPSSQDDGSMLFPHLTEDSAPEPQHSAPLGRGLFDRVLLGVSHSEMKPPEPEPVPAETPRDSLVFATSDAVLEFVEKCLMPLPVGIKSVLASCLVAQMRTPCATAILLSQKIMKVLLKGQGAPKVGEGAVRVPCISLVLSALNQLLRYSGPNYNQFLFGLSSACVLVLVLVLDIARALAARGLSLQPKLLTVCRDTLSVAMGRLLVLSTSPLYSEAATAWLLSCTAAPSTSADATMRAFVTYLGAQYGQCSSELFSYLMTDYPDSDKENTEVHSPSPKKARPDEAMEEARVTHESQQEEGRLAVQTLVRAPKVQVTSRTDSRGLTGRRQALATFPMFAARPAAPVKRASDGEARYGGGMSMQSPTRPAGSTVIPCTPDSIIKNISLG